MGALAVPATPVLADTSRLSFDDPDQLTHVVGRQAAFVDIDGDGDLDSFVGTDAGAIRYFENVGTTTLPRYQERTGAANPFNGINVGGKAAPAFVDIDGDGDFDAVVGAADGTLRFYRNIGSPTAPLVLQETGAGNPFTGVDVGTRSTPVFADLDGDGDYDALVGAYDGTLRYFENTGTVFSPAYTPRTGAANPFNGVDVGTSAAPAVVDIDGDADPDVFIGNKTTNIAYYQNTGTRNSPAYTLRTGAANPLTGFNSTNSAPSFADIDGDGDFDALIGPYAGPVQRITNFGSASSPDFAKANPLATVSTGYTSTPAFVDIDADGDLDAFAGGYTGTVQYFENTGTNSNPHFVQRSGIANPLNAVSLGSYAAVTFVDIDGDGDKDAFIGAGDGTTHFFKNIGTASAPVFTDTTGVANPLDGVNVGARSAPVFVDIDGDSDYDAFIGAADGSLHFYRNTGTSTGASFVAVVGVADPCNAINVGGEAKPAFADIDGDGDMDLVIGSSSGLLRIFENTGTASLPVFTERSGANNPLARVNVASASAPALADIDGDGDIDVFIGEYYGTVGEFRNETQFADLDIAQSALPSPALLESPTNFRLTITNHGRDSATGVAVTDTLPADAEFISASSDAGSCTLSAGTVTCLLGSIPRNGVVYVDISVRPTTLTTLSNTASVTADQLDSIQFNNQTTTSVAVNPAIDLGVTVLPDPGVIYAGTALSYAVTLHNQGPSTATGLVLSDALPNGTSLVSATAASGTCVTADATVTCALDDLAAGNDALVTLIVRPLVAGPLANTLNVNANETDLNPVDNGATATVTVNPAVDLGITVTPNSNPVYAGTALSYAVTLHNQGPSTATGLVLSDALPNGTSLVSAMAASGTCLTAASTVTCALDDLAAGNDALVTLIVRPLVAGPLANTLSVNANETDLNAADNSATPTVMVNPAADIGIAIAPGPDPIYVGTDLTYIVTLSNQGPGTATGLTLSDPLPNGVSLQSAISADGSCTLVNSLLTCAMNALAPGDTESVTLTLQSAVAGSLANSVTATANETDLNAADNGATATVMVNPAADVGLAMVPGPDPIYAGVDLNYAITLRNQGPSTATGLVLSGIFPNGVSLLSATSTDGICTAADLAITCAMNDLSAGNDALATFTVRPVASGPLANSVTVTANETDLNPADNSVTATVTVNPAVDLGITVTPSPNPVYAGRALSYAVTLRNQGPSAATGVVLNNVLPNGVSPLSATTTDGACTTAGAAITCGLNDLAAGNEALVTVVVLPTAAGPLANILSVNANETSLNPAANTAVVTVEVNPPPDNNGGGGASEPWSLLGVLGALLRRRRQGRSLAKSAPLPRQPHA